MAPTIGSPQDNKSLRNSSFALIALGWLISAYLLLRMVTIGTARLRFKPGISAGLLCSGCDDALASAYAFVKGLPLAGIGLAYFAVIGFLLAFGGVWATRLAFLVCALGMGGSIWLSTALFSAGGSICFLCVLVHVANLALLIALFLMISRQEPRLLPSKTWAGVAIVLMATSGLLQATLLRPSLDAQKLATQFRAEPLFEIPILPTDAVLGPPDGRVRLVVFSSFQCPWCQRFAPTVHYLNEHYGDKLTIVFKNYPLGKACNPAMRGDMQPRACAAAWAAEAANLQKAFWRYHDGLFADSLQDSDEMLAATARSAGLDLKRWDEDRKSPIVQLKIFSDVQVGMRLGIEGTPAVYLDGRKVINPNLTVLETLIREEIRRAV